MVAIDWNVAAIPAAYYAVAANGPKGRVGRFAFGECMTSEPDSTPRRRPPTIDLTAQEIETAGQPGSSQGAAAADGAKDRAAGDAPGGRADRNSFSGAQPYVLGAAAGAIVVAAIVAGGRLAGLVPARDTAPPLMAPAAPGARTPASDEISSRLDKIQQALQAPRPAPDAVLASRLAGAEAQTKSLNDALTALTRRVDEIAATSQSALAQAKAAAAASQEAKNAVQAGVPRGDVDALANHIAALESAVKSLSTSVASADAAQRTSSADDRAARATIAAEALRAAVERGAPYQAELAAVKSLGADPNAAAPLALFAADGVPSAAALGRELAELTPALLHASGVAPNESSILGRLEAHAQQLVHVTPLDAPPGDDPSSVIARINTEATRGDVAAALADIGRLPEAVRSVAEGWVKKAEAREAAIAAGRRIAAAALAALGGPASQ